MFCIMTGNCHLWQIIFTETVYRLSRHFPFRYNRLLTLETSLFILSYTCKNGCAYTCPDQNHPPPPSTHTYTVIPGKAEAHLKANFNLAKRIIVHAGSDFSP